MGFLAFWYRPSVPSMKTMRAVFGSSVSSQAFSQWILDSTRFTSLLFADDVVSLASSVVDLRHALDRFVAECEVTKMRIGILKSEAVVLC